MIVYASLILEFIYRLPPLDEPLINVNLFVPWGMAGVVVVAFVVYAIKSIF